MGLSYAREKLSNAVHELAVSPASIQTRLEHAFLSFSALSDRDFVGSQHLPAWQSIYRKLTADKSGSPDDGHVRTTTSRLSDEDASQLAREIVELSSMLDFDEVLEAEKGR